MIRVVALSMIFICQWPAFAGTLLDVIHGTRAENGIIVLVQPGNALCEDAAASGFTVLALDSRAGRVAALRQLFLDRGLYGRVSASLSDGQTLPCIDELVNLVVVEEGRLSAGTTGRPREPRTTIGRPIETPIHAAA